MIFVDTNYFLRFLRDDIPEQTGTVKALFLAASEGKKKLFTSTIVFFEIFWVIKSFYSEKKERLIKTLQKVLDLDFIKIEEKEVLKDTLEVYGKTNLELEDCYNLAYAKAHKMTKFATFDKKLSKYI